MKEREQKIFGIPETCPPKNRTESEGYVGGQTFMWIAENDITNKNQREYGLLEFILSPNNLNKAYLQVLRNKGAGGIDKMQVESLRDYLVEHKDELITAILKGNYRPKAVRRVEIPKENGKKRQLGIPTVIDRVFQQAIAQVLTPVYERQFSPFSYGFRPKRDAHKALHQCKRYIDEGYVFAVDMDLEKFFDRVNHSKLIEVLSRTIKDGRVISLIHKYLNAKVKVADEYETNEQGVPQGGPLSPLLGNIMLNELDKELDKRGHKYVRYADDLLIFCKSKRSAERTMGSIIPFIENRMYLKVNMEKSKADKVSNVKFLGYSFYRPKGICRFRIHPSSTEKLKGKLKELTSRSNGWGNERRKEALKQFITGWVNYFRLADIQNLLSRVDEWLRRRIRMVIWKQWKHTKTKMRNLMKLGTNKSKAWEWANTRKGYWRIAGSFILSSTITNDKLNRAGYIFLCDYYSKVRFVY
ncbi:group II intron reverse transcriptase/maturase [Zavarzinia sp.]|uniref:group II intron reverse transcriptase/maturase n=1 Tax=Zavarzinia sp. TaxID=2027920 RepID=UPI003BB6C737